MDALSHPTVRQASLPTTVHERKVDVSGAVSGAVVAARETKTKQGTDILGGPGRTRTCNQTVMSGRISVTFVDLPAFCSSPIAFVTFG